MDDLSEGACLVIAVLATTGTLRFFDLNEKLEAARHPLGLDNAGPLGFYGHPQHAGPAQSRPDEDSREHHLTFHSRQELLLRLQVLLGLWGSILTSLSAGSKADI